MIKRKICVITGSRAEYGLLYWLIKDIESDKDLDLQLIVTGMHLSSEFGLTYKEIENEFKIEKKIDIQLSSDTSNGISSSMSIAQKSFSEALIELEPDIVVVLGDRYEIFSAVSAAMIAKIPIAHIHGGEITQGSWDDCMRHCITKMSSLHFTSTEEYRKRVIQLGEHPDTVFKVGALGVENIKKREFLDKDKLESALDFVFGEKNLLVTFHPLSLDENQTNPLWVSIEDNTLIGIPDELGMVPVYLILSDGEISIIDTFDLYVEQFMPVMTSITDVPDDQGGRVYVNFNSSFFDDGEDSGQLYSLFRYDSFENDSSGWVLVESGGAIGSFVSNTKLRPETATTTACRTSARSPMANWSTSTATASPMPARTATVTA